MFANDSFSNLLLVFSASSLDGLRREENIPEMRRRWPGREKMADAFARERSCTSRGKDRRKGEGKKNR